MPISARNQLTGRITEILLGEAMGLKKGDTVTAVIKSTEVMLMKE